jgi:transcriptional regulator with XRE-family HTH domain
MRGKHEERAALLETLSCRLREARVRAGLTQVEVAAAVDVCEDVYARYERGTALPSVETFELLCRVVNCSADWLLDEDGSAPPPEQQHDEDLRHSRRLRRVSRQLRQASPDTLRLVRSVLDELTSNQTS